MWAISETLHGIGEAARALHCPVVSGNVSLYNATGDQPILPTAVIAAVGRIPGENPPCPSGFCRVGDDIWLVGRFEPRLDGSLWARHRLGRWAGRVAPVDFAAENALSAWLRAHIAQGDLHSALDLSSGGLAVALARACLRGPYGERGCQCDAAELPATAATWFGETAATALVSCARGRPLALTAEQQAAGLALRRLGTVTDSHLAMKAGPLQLRLDELALPWRQSAARLVSGPPLGADFPLYVRDLCHR
jgi:phosphoribosylformylglycinamidine synthase